MTIYTVALETDKYIYINTDTCGERELSFFFSASRIPSVGACTQKSPYACSAGRDSDNGNKR